MRGGQMPFFWETFSGKFSAYLEQMINTVTCLKEMGTILSFRRQIIMPCGFDTFVISPPPGGGGGRGGKEGFRMDMMGMLDGKIERDQTWRGSGLIWPVCCCCLFVWFFERKNNKRCPQHGYKFWLSVPGWTEETAAMFFFFWEMLHYFSILFI